MINNFTLQGRLTADPELKNTNSGTTVCSFTLASDIGSGEKKKTLFMTCKAWKGTGETIAKFCKKGNMLIISGTLEPNDWTDKDGNKRKSYEVIVDQFGFCESNKSNNSSPFEDDNPGF
jgi:single-strand DNA-binding protein